MPSIVNAKSLTAHARAAAPKTFFSYGSIGAFQGFCHAGRCIRDQAPGDGDALCTDEIVDGIMNPFFANRPVYSASERPLMESRDYVRLLQGSGDVYLPCQSVDIDNNNTNEEVMRVSKICYFFNKKLWTPSEFFSSGNTLLRTGRTLTTG